MKFNINSTVKVRLTDHGRQFYKEMWLRSFSGLNWPYNPPVEDDEGYSSWSLLRLMSVFSREINISNNKCFEDEIEIPDQEVKS